MQAYRQQAKRMKVRAQGELKRRELFENAMNLLLNQTESALEHFALAASIDLYIPDIECLVERHGDLLREHPGIREQLRTQLLKAYSDKFGWRRYERLPEVMRLQREQAGMERINELLK